MARAKIKSNIIAGDGQTITGLRHGGGTITEVWLDSKRLYSLPKHTEVVYVSASQHTIPIPAWADNVTFFIIGGNGGGQAGNGSLASRNGEGGRPGYGRVGNRRLLPGQRGGTVRLTIGAGGTGGQADSEPGGQGEPSSIKITAGDTTLLEHTVEGGAGGNNIGGIKQYESTRFALSKAYPGIDTTEYSSFRRPGSGGNGGIFGSYGKGEDGDPGYARIIFTRGIDPGEK